MLSDEVIEKLSKRLTKRLDEANEYILKKIGESIKKIGTLSYSNAQELAQMLKYGGDYEKIVKKLAEVTDLNVKDIKKIFHEVAKENLDFDEGLYKYRNTKFIPYKDNKILQDYVDSIAKVTQNAYINLANTKAIGYLVKDNNGNVVFRQLGNLYRDVIDKAVLNVSQGKETFDTEMYKIMKDIGGSGLRQIEYKSGHVRRLDSAISMNIKDAIRDLSINLQQKFGEEFDADGVEITVHENPAPDHELVQGRQFRNEEFKKFQNDEDAKSVDGIEFPKDYDGHDRRSIGQYNCYHYVFPIIVGVSKPTYTSDELQAIIDRNHKGFEIDGKHYTNYQGMQMQRKLESAIRTQKDMQILGRSSGNDQLAQESQRNINYLRDKYVELSKKSGLSTEMDRLRVSGYRKIKVEDNAVKVANNIQTPPLAKYQTLLNKSEGGIALGDTIYQDMLKDYDKWYNSLDKAEVKKVLDDYQEYVNKSNEIKMSNPIGEFLNKKFGYDGLPELIDEKDYFIDEFGESVLAYKDTTSLDNNHWFRGISGENAQKYIKEFKSGKFFAGEGYDANGTFVTNSYEEAKAYSKHDENKIIYIIPKDNIKTINAEKIYGHGTQISRQINFNKYMNEDGELYIDFTDKILNDNGYMATIFGYDILDFQKNAMSLDRRKVVLNRKSIKVVK